MSINASPIISASVGLSSTSRTLTEAGVFKSVPAVT
jgi:hypothetical protein